MDLIFTRTGTRRYAVTARRTEHPDVACSPAPGFHDRIPHDLVHLVAERRFELREGIYGALAAGGDAGTFLPADGSYDRRYARRAARRAPKGPDMTRSEELAALLHVRWCRRHGLDEGVVVDHGALPREPAARHVRSLEAALDDLDGFAERWAAVEAGTPVVEPWPRPERPASHRRRA